jgi:hypothetical protein
MCGKKNRNIVIGIVGDRDSREIEKEMHNESFWNFLSGSYDDKSDRNSQKLTL